MKPSFVHTVDGLKCTYFNMVTHSHTAFCQGPSSPRLFDSLIHYSAFSAAKAMQHEKEIWDRETIPYSYDWSKEIF